MKELLLLCEYRGIHKYIYDEKNQNSLCTALTQKMYRLCTEMLLESLGRVYIPGF